MLRHGSRRPWRLVRVGVPSSCLAVLTGTRRKGPSRAGGRTRAHVRAGTLGAVSVETLRRAVFALVAELSGVLHGDETPAGGRMRRGGRWLR